MQTGKITALYVRFSFDDGIDTESGSIEHQKALLKNYAVIFPVCILVSSYTDRLKFAISILAQIRNKRNQKREIVAESSQSVTGLQQSKQYTFFIFSFQDSQVFQSIYDAEFPKPYAVF